MPWWIRAFLVFAVIQGLGIGLTGLVLPPEMQIPLRISPLNTRFVAALYVAGGVGVLWAAIRARTKFETRLFVIGFGLVTGMILVVTLLHWPDFMSDPLPHRPIWIFDYVADPLLALLIVWLGGLRPRWGPRHPLLPLLWVEAALFGLLGLALLVAPDQMAAAWPWALPPVLGQVYGCFFVTFAVGALLASRETEPRSVAAFVLSSFVLAVLVLVASTLHVDRFKPEPISVIWFAGFAVAAVAFGVAGVPLWLRQRCL